MTLIRFWGVYLYIYIYTYTLIYNCKKEPQKLVSETAHILIKPSNPGPQNLNPNRAQKKHISKIRIGDIPYKPPL